jgi:hypothetical protein
MLVSAYGLDERQINNRQHTHSHVTSEVKSPPMIGPKLVTSVSCHSIVRHLLKITHTKPVDPEAPHIAKAILRLWGSSNVSDKTDCADGMAAAAPRPMAHGTLLTVGPISRGGKGPR